MNRNKAAKKYKWDFSKLYKTKPEFLEDLEFLSLNYRTQTLFKGLLKNYEDFRDFDVVSEQGNKISARLEQYLKILEVEPHNKLALELQAAYEKELEVFDGQFAWIEEEIKAIGETQIMEWLKTDPKWIPYAKSYQKFFKNLKYLLPESQRILLSKVSKSSELAYEMYETLKWKDNDVKYFFHNQKKYLLTQNNLTNILEESRPIEDQEVRALAIRKFHENDYNNKHALAKIYENIVKEETESLKLIGMKHFSEQFFDDENITETEFLNLVDFASKNSDVYFEYYKMIKDVLGFQDKFYGSDASLTLVKTKGNKIKLKSGIKIIKQALLPLGKEYGEALANCFKENRIDYFESPHKSSGAFTTFSYDYGSLISINWQDNFSSLMTLTHELGHAVHSELAKQSQPKPLNCFNNIIAEVASTLNEQILLDFWLKKNKSSAVRINLLKERVEFIFNNFFSGIEESYFEYLCFQAVDKEEVLTSEKLIEIQKIAVKKVFNKNSFDSYDDKIKAISWSFSSHIFEQPFYLYKYALSLVMSLKLFQEYENSNFEIINNFLKEGGNLPPQELFKKYGVDIKDSKSYEPLISYLKKLVDEIKTYFDAN
ncbi:oligoendopeptidase F [Spiroplasma sabaudiense Ar-1343]|uniref:Oligoendopeptidase F n=1 Tax=Spiroplasma sabaudiense Ar-1343 TaxID=1276257 RepID=W6AJG3_9MOLU|nr:M3 family metallopeptidase [Spiroplasma sabaudiense]AHI53859.1 oligoendopeptidase F [Spiroplasma sabaudiense Ar-1343]